MNASDVIISFAGTGFGAVVLIGLTIIFAVIAWYIYHNVFDVAYFGCGGCAIELVVCGLIGAVIAYLLLLPFGWVFSIFL